MRFAKAARAATTFVLTAAALACGEAPVPTTPASVPEGPQLITNGVPTGGSFGNVGALLIDDEADGVLDGFCTGSLIAETVFLTAAHCVNFGPDAVFYVTFAPDITPLPTDLIRATAAHAHPDFNPGSLKEDVGVVLLPVGATTGITPLELPPEGYLDGLVPDGNVRDRLRFISVGYGDESVRPGPPTFRFDGVREMALSPLRALTTEWLGLHSNTQATDDGGSCFGDSGGPKFPESDPTLVVAVQSWSGAICQANEWAYRLDTAQAREFLANFVTLP